MRLVASGIQPARIMDGPIIARPEPITRSGVAAHLGMAADAIAAALHRWNQHPYAATGQMLQHAELELDDAFPGLISYLPSQNPLWNVLAQARDGVHAMSLQYFAGELPGSAATVPYVLARYTYDVRMAQALLIGVGSTLVDPASGYTASGE